jgi:hypothetical protein
MYVFTEISSVAENNTIEKMSYVSAQLNKIIKELLEGAACQAQGAVFSLSDLYPKAKNQAEEVTAPHDNDKNMKG